MTGRTISIAAAAALALALGAFALDTRSDHDDSFDFATLERYRWAEGTAAVSPVVQEHIEGAVRTQLEAKGLSEDAEAPDVWVVTHAATATRVRFDAAEHGYGYRWRNWGPTSVNFRDIEPGTLVVDLVDAETKELIWRGIAGDALSPKAKKAEKSEKDIVKAAEKLFESFPPEE